MRPEITLEVKENVKQVSGERWLVGRAEQEEDVGEDVLEEDVEDED